MPTEQSKTKRPAVSKHVRFEVFKRDGFTCQYCQRSGVDVILHLDHKHPVSRGGSSDVDNLVTSCEDCNLGKSANLLTAPATAVRRNPSPKIRLATSARDGHSLGQQAVYDALWGAGQPSADGSRTVALGLGKLSKLARISLNNCRMNIRGLVDKLAVEVVEDERSREQIGKTYRVRPESEILAARKAAGLEWVVRSRGVNFVPAE